MHIPISTKLDFSTGEMSQNKQTKTLGKSQKYRDCPMPKILFYPSDRCKCWSKSPSLCCLCVNFWIVYFQESLAQVKVCTVGNQQLLQLKTPTVQQSALGSFKQGGNPFYKDNLLLQTKAIKQQKALWRMQCGIFFGLLNAPHTDFFFFFPVQMILQGYSFLFR